MDHSFWYYQHQPLRSQDSLKVMALYKNNSFFYWDKCFFPFLLLCLWNVFISYFQSCSSKVLAYLLIFLLKWGWQIKGKYLWKSKELLRFDKIWKFTSDTACHSQVANKKKKNLWIIWLKHIVLALRTNWNKWFMSFAFYSGSNRWQNISDLTASANSTKRLAFGRMKLKGKPTLTTNLSNPSINILFCTIVSAG